MHETRSVSDLEPYISGEVLSKHWPCFIQVSPMAVSHSGFVEILMTALLHSGASLSISNPVP